MGKRHAQSDTAERGTDDARHEGFVAHERESLSLVVDNDALEEPQQHVEHGYAVDGLHTELPPQYLQGKDEQDNVDEHVRVLDGDVRRIVHDGGDTRHATRSDLVGDEESRPPEGVENQPQCDEQIVLHLCPHVGDANWFEFVHTILDV